MPYSMTGYAKIQSIINDYKITCEIKTLNSKGFNVDVYLPYFLNSKELDVISKVKEYITKGKVSVRVWVRFIKPVQITVDYSLVRTYYEMLSEIRENLGIPVPVELSHLLSFRELFQFEFSNEEIEIVWKSVATILQEVLQQVVQERKTEGEKLVNDLSNMSRKMRQIVTEIRSKANEVPKYIAERIRTNMKEILPDDVEINKELFENALAILADRADIREEITRLESHLQRVDELLMKDEPVGDMLNFLSQEIQREFNTILSKSKTLDISSLALEGKYLVSQFKEQVMNLE
ncbi:MAG: YicC family protein [Fervidobacterium sp.]|nr:YicC family protein [Fervidobacterium sp.]